MYKIIRGKHKRLKAIEAVGILSDGHGFWDQHDNKDQWTIEELLEKFKGKAVRINISIIDEQ